MASRADIAAALGTVDGITAHQAPPVTPQPLDAWPVWSHSELATLGRGWSTTWDVWVVLPNATTEETIDAADPLVDPVGNALAHLGAVLTVAPGRTLAQSNTTNAVPALKYTLQTL